MPDGGVEMMPGANGVASQELCVLLLLATSHSSS